MVKLLSSGAKHCAKFLGVGAEEETPLPSETWEL